MAGKKQDKFLSLFFNIFLNPISSIIFSPKKGPSWGLILAQDQMQLAKDEQVLADESQDPWGR